MNGALTSACRADCLHVPLGPSCTLAIVPGSADSLLLSFCRLAYGTDQGRWLMEQVQSAPDGAKRRLATRPQHAFHDEDTLGAVPPQPQQPSDALSVRQGALCAGAEGPVWKQPRVLAAAGCAIGFLLLSLIHI